MLHSDLLIDLFLQDQRNAYKIIMFLTKCDKSNIIGWAKAHSKTGFQQTVENPAEHDKDYRLKRNSRCTLISGCGELFSKWGI